jgi:predicted phosphoadenosine phosphosulfate sulfurtransferase
MATMDKKTWENMGNTNRVGGPMVESRYASQKYLRYCRIIIPSA